MVVQLQGHYQQAQAIVDQHYNNTYRQVEDICSGKYLANIGNIANWADILC